MKWLALPDGLTDHNVPTENMDDLLTITFCYNRFSSRNKLNNQPAYEQHNHKKMTRVEQVQKQREGQIFTTAPTH